MKCEVQSSATTFGAAPELARDVLGSALIDGTPRTIIGVMPKAFGNPYRGEAVACPLGASA